MAPGGISRAAPAGSPSHTSSKEPNGRIKNKNKNRSKKRKRRTGGDVDAAAHPPSASRPAAAPPSPKHKRVKEIPARFTHPQLDAELRRLRRSWLSPGDPLFQAALDVSYRGMRHVPAGALPKTLHAGFRQSFDELHEAGLFMYDTVQAGGKRLSRTFVTRTLLGDPGITYKVRKRKGSPASIVGLSGFASSKRSMQQQQCGARGADQLTAWVRKLFAKSQRRRSLSQLRTHGHPAEATMEAIPRAVRVAGTYARGTVPGDLLHWHGLLYSVPTEGLDRWTASV